MCIPTLIVVTALVVYSYKELCIYNVWPETIFHTETESKRLTIV